jgi:hypothetical protein
VLLWHRTLLLVLYPRLSEWEICRIAWNVLFCKYKEFEDGINKCKLIFSYLIFRVTPVGTFE